MTGALVLAGVITLASFIVWLLLREGRARGKAEAETEAAIIDQKTVSDVQEIQAGPIPSRDALLEHMRDPPPN